MIKVRASEDFCIVTVDSTVDPYLVAQMIKTEYYDKGDTCFNEIMDSIELIGCGMELALRIIAACMDIMDGDSLVRINEGEDIHEEY